MTNSPKQTRPRRLVASCGALALAMSAGGCVGLTPQLHPTDVVALEQLEDFDDRNLAYNDNAIYRQVDPRGVRYVKGTRMGARPRGWQSLDLILRSDRNSAAALPERKIRTARVLTGFLIASGIVLLGGLAASAREGMDLSRLTGTSAILLVGGASSVAFGIASGVVWGQAKAGYEDAVDIYNDSLALRLGITDANGDFKVPEGLLVDEEGFIILDQKELLVPEMRGQPAGSRVGPQAAPPEAAPPAEVVPPEPVPPPEVAPPAEAAPPPEAAPPEPQPDSSGAGATQEPSDPDATPKPGPSTAGLLGPSRGAP